MISNDELKTFKPWLVSVAQTGSGILPWIENPHDTDYIFYVRNRKDVKKLILLFKLRPKNECWIVDELEVQGTRLYSYEYYYLKPVFGNDFPTYNILEHVNDYKRELIKKGLGKPFIVEAKFWYHVLTGIYLLDNEKYELTEEQISNIQLLHDRKGTQELYDYIQERLKYYEAEL